MYGISGWVRSVAGAAILISVVLSICPKTAPRSAAALIGSIIFSVVLIAPLKKFDWSHISDALPEYEQLVQEMSERAQMENRELREKIIEDEVEAYILKRADNIGIKCEVEVDCEGEACSARISANSRRDVEKLSKLMREECGISKIEVGE